ncbi:hypothetical protein IWZ00DRAFT_47636 [Phyllosticta capitalensis]
MQHDSSRLAGHQFLLYLSMSTHQTAFLPNTQTHSFAFAIAFAHVCPSYALPRRQASSWRTAKLENWRSAQSISICPPHLQNPTHPLFLRYTALVCHRQRKPSLSPSSHHHHNQHQRKHSPASAPVLHTNTACLLYAPIPPFLSYAPTSYLPSTTSQRYVVRPSRRFPRAQPKRQSVPPTAALCLPFRARRVDVIGGIGATRQCSRVRYRRPLRQNFCRSRSLAVGVCGVSGAIHTSYSRRPSCATAAFPFPYHPFSSFRADPIIAASRNVFPPQLVPASPPALSVPHFWLFPS